MRKKYLTLFAAILFLAALWSTAAAESLTWNEYHRGLKLARMNNKKVMISFYAYWCGYCRQLESETFADKDVADFLRENFVLIKVDTERSRDLSRTYMVRALPTIWFLKPDGGKIGSLPGFVPPEPFLNVLRQAKDQ